MQVVRKGSGWEGGVRTGTCFEGALRGYEVALGIGASWQVA